MGVSDPPPSNKRKRTMATVMIVILMISCLFGHVLSDDPHHRGHRGMNKDHIKDELHGMLPEDDYDLGSDEAVELHYFKLHDYDKNNKLDGLEMGAAMTHYHDADEDGNKRNNRVDIADEEYFEMIAQMLRDDDLNDDGYVDFYEFMKAQRRNNVPEADSSVI